MTPKETKQMLPIMTAFANGETVEHCSQNQWTVVEDPGWGDVPSCYRIKPKLRPWKPDEVPVGAIIRAREGYKRLVITEVNAIGWTAGGLTYAFGELRQFTEWKWPQEPETAWRPIGVPE